MNTFADNLRKINEHRESLVKHLATSPSEYGFGGAHRLWVRECAVLTADEYIRRADAFSKQMGGMPIVMVSHLAIPMPPSWKGERPAECSEYGHPHSKGKDWRHFENTLRWRFAEKGWLSTQISLNDDKEIVFVADKMINVARMPFSHIKKEDFEGKPPMDDAVLPDQPYDEWCATCDENFRGSKIAEQKAMLENVPYFLRPMMALGMCGGGEADVSEDPK